MSPDYELPDEVEASGPERLKALADPIRMHILTLVMERAATVTELAAALDRPKSSVAHHVDTLVDAGLLRVVRTRKVRAIEERFYGRTGRTIVISPGEKDSVRHDMFAEATAEMDTSDLGVCRGTIRHARIPDQLAGEFFERVAALADEFTRLPSGGDTMWGFVASVYPTTLPVLPSSS